MNRRSTNCWAGCCRRAFTLVEVVASLMLLGTLLVSILIAHRRHAEQIRTAERRLAAVHATDELLAKWSAEGSWGATKNEGRFDEREDLAWRWTVVSAPGLQRVGAAVGRLEVVDPDGQLLTQVELLTVDTMSR